jgi:ribosomal protein S18 acetylase RimI-like enzyme
MVKITVANSVSDELLRAINDLLPQLSRRASPMTTTQLAEVIDSPGNELLVAYDDGRVVGILVLVVYRIPTGIRSRIEDVVVDESFRGKGTATALLRRALEIADDRGARTVDLTSNPGREGANRLYEQIGFTRRDTVVFRR